MEFLAGSASMLFLDSLYLRMVKGQWDKMVASIQGSPLALRLMPAVAVYILMSFALYYFIVVPGRSVYDAALLGLVIYGVFDMTNLALFAKYGFAAAVVDVLWGALLFAASAFVVRTVFRKRA